MCNLYSLQTSHEAMIQLFRIENGDVPEWTGKSGIYPGQLAPVVHRDTDGLRALSMMRWGFPPPPKGNRPVTNVRNLSSGFWTRWLKEPEQRCLVPLTSFCEWSQSPPKTPHWFSLGDSDEIRTVAAFAGICRNWQGERRGEQAEHQLMAFLTTDANDVVRPIHPKAMPVLLQPEDYDTWLHAPWDEAHELVNSPLSDQLRVVNVGNKSDTQRTMPSAS